MNDILLDEHGEASGIIDFGDMLHSFTLLEVAVCMSSRAKAMRIL